jgi:hypothetical protein
MAKFKSGDARFKIFVEEFMAYRIKTGGPSAGILGLPVTNERIKDHKLMRDQVHEALVCMHIYSLLPWQDSLNINSRDMRAGDILKGYADSLRNHYNISINDISWNPTSKNYKEFVDFKGSYINVRRQAAKERSYTDNLNFQMAELVFNSLNLTMLQLGIDKVQDEPYKFVPPGSYIERLRQWRPYGCLLTTISTHKDEVRTLARLNDKNFLSGSYDGTIRCFDVTKVKTDFTSRNGNCFDINNDPVFKEGSAGEPAKIKEIKYIEELHKCAVMTDTNKLCLMDVEYQKGVTNHWSAGSEILAFDV